MLSKKVLLPIFIALLLATSTLVSQANEPASETIRKYVLPAVEYEYLMGVSVGYIKNGEVGFVNIGQMKADGKAVDENTVFEIGSVTKTFTALILADMAIKKEVELDRPVQGLLPLKVSVPKYGDEHITLRHLAKHNSGLPRMPNNFQPEDPQNPYADYTLEDLFEFLNGYKLPRAPGASYEYSNLGAGLLGHALSYDTDKSYDELLAARITGPLGMKDTVIALSDKQKDRLAKGHNLENEPVKHWDIPTFAAAGAIRSTTRDMVSYLQVNMGLAETQLNKAIELTHTNHTPTNSERHDLALGWHVRKKDGALWHNGGTGGFHSFCILDKKNKTGLVILSNTSTFQVDKIGWGILEILNGLDPIPLNFRKEVQFDPEIFKKYIGTYKLSPKFELTIYTKNDKFYSKGTGQGAIRIYPESESVFFTKALDARIEFVTNNKGKVKKLILHQNGTFSGKKIK